MPTTTALGLPVPSDTDPVSDGALAMRNLAAAQDVKKIRKAAAQAVTNSTVLVNDTHLACPVEANKTYLIDLVLIVLASATTVDFKFGFTFPAAGTLVIGATGPDIAAASFTEKQINIGGAAGSGATFVAMGINGTSVIRISGSYKGGANPGSLQLVWAQNTAVAATSTQVEAGSTMRVEVAN